MKVLKGIRNILVVILIFGLVSAGYDYFRIANGNQPVFCIKSYESRSKLETNRGLFYVVERTIKADQKENFKLSRKVIFKFLTINKELKYKEEKVKEDFILILKEQECNNSTLYKELDDKKVYLDCLEEVNVKYEKDKKSKPLKDVLDEEFLNELLNKMSYVGLTNNTETFKNLDDAFISKDITIYKCNWETKDIYITRNNKMEDDYCKIKDDTIKQED